MNKTWRLGLLALALGLALYTFLRPVDEMPQQVEPPRRAPLVIGHRGASGYRPEHTLESYRLAIELGADFIEPDLVATRDGVLIVRHENLLDGTTDIVARVGAGELPDRRATKSIDGVEVTGYFSEDYTLAEIRKLRARERIPSVRPDNAKYDGRFAIPTLVEVIRLLKQVEERDGIRIGIYPETKHPTFFAAEGTFAGGGKIGIDLGAKLIETLVAENFTDPSRIFIQSFEVANLLALQNEIMPKHGIDLPLVQLLGDTGRAPTGPTDAFRRPYDFYYHAQGGPAAVQRIYGGLADLVSISTTTGWAALTDEDAVRWMAEHYAEAIGPWKNSILPREPISPNEALESRIRTRLTGEVAPLLGYALQAGLGVHPYTLRAEEQFLALSADGTPQDVVQEALQLLRLGVTGFFIDQPDLGRRACDAIGGRND